MLAAGLLLVPWAINPHSWWKALDYRNWMVPISVIVMGACALDAWRKADRASLWRERQPTLIAIGTVFLLVLTLQGLTWNRLTNRLLEAMRSGGCIQRESLAWTNQTPFDHWSTADYAIVLQGRTPHCLVLDGEACNEYLANGTVRILSFSRKGASGWFDLDQVRSGARSH